MSPLVLIPTRLAAASWPFPAQPKFPAFGLVAAQATGSRFSTQFTATCVSTQALLSDFDSSAAHPKQSFPSFVVTSCSASAGPLSTASAAGFTFSNCLPPASGLARFR